MEYKINLAAVGVTMAESKTKGIFGFICMGQQN